MGHRPEFSVSNFRGCIFGGLCEEARTSTTALPIQPRFPKWVNLKRQDLVYEKDDLLISGPGKYPEYNFLP